MHVYVLYLKLDSEPEVIGMIADSHEKAQKVGNEWMEECERINPNSYIQFRIKKFLLNEPTF